jgi:hypothetical protein
MSFQDFIARMLSPSNFIYLDKIVPKLSINDAELGDVNKIIWHNASKHPDLDLELGLPLKQYMQNTKNKK